MWDPLVLGTWKFGVKAAAAAWRVLVEQGGTALDAVVAGCQAVEDDPEVTSVGYGGLPDALGQVSLDAAVMLSPEKSAGVAFIRQFAHAARLARLVMECTGHKLLVGEGAERLARDFGWPAQELRTQHGLTAWRRWLAAQAPSIGQEPVSAQAAPGGPDVSAGKLTGPGISQSSTPPGGEFGKKTGPNSSGACAEPPGPEMAAHDTIGVLVRHQNGELAAGCSTSGIAFKLPGRVGDSPIIGHGLYVDPSVGAAVATGNGELIMGVCGTFLAVECLRRGATPEEAAAEVIRRIAASYSDLDNKQAAIIVLSAKGGWGAAALRPGFQVAVRSPTEDALREPGFIYFS